MPRLRFVSTVEGADTIELQEPVITIGRGINNVVCIEDANISKNHVLLIREDDTYRIFDLHSVNGTIINGKRINVATLHAGDAVRIGYLDLTYESTTPTPAKPVVAEPPAPPVSAAPAPATPVVTEPAPPPPVTPVVTEPAPPPPVTPVVTEPAAPPPPVPAPPATAPISVPPVPPARPRFGFSKPAAAPTPPPTPAPTTLIPMEPAPAKAAQPTEPIAPVPAEPPAEGAGETAPAGQKKFGAPPGGQNLKFRLKRE